MVRDLWCLGNLIYKEGEKHNKLYYSLIMFMLLADWTQIGTKNPKLNYQGLVGLNCSQSIGG